MPSWRGQDFQKVQEAKDYWTNASLKDLVYIMSTTKKQRVDWISVATKIVTPGSSVLDVGCGTGLMVEALPKDVDYYGIDLNEEYLGVARKQYPGYTFENRDMYDLFEGDRKFDFVVITSLFGLFPEEETYILMNKFWSLATKGMAITTLNKDRYRKAPGRSRIKNALTSHDPIELEEFLKSLPGSTKVEVVSDIHDGSSKPMKMAAYAWKEQ
jgi:2-polyprenyl-3-methyl-5-hydroxy-6-metoxy-1,4-benzoquinol methylase